MIQRLDDDVRHRLISRATDEAKRRGDDRIGTEHLLLALLAGADSATCESSTLTSTAHGQRSTSSIGKPSSPWAWTCPGSSRRSRYELVVARH